MPKLSQEGRGEETLGGRLTRVRIERGWTQQRLADMVGTSQAVVQRIETGKCRHPRIINELAESLDVSPAWLMYGSRVVDGLEREAIETARAWSKLGEPHRSTLRDMILRFAREAEAERAKVA